MNSIAKIFFLTSFVAILISSCGSDVDPGIIEGPPRSSEAIYQQDLRFFQTKESLLGADLGDTSQILFGDLHVHTKNSFDAFLFGTTATPDDAYKYAKGDSIKHPLGYDMQLDDPLDFYAVTDHGAWLGMMEAYSDPDSTVARALAASSSLGGGERRNSSGVSLILIRFGTELFLEYVSRM